MTAPVVSRDGQAAMPIAYPTTGEQDAATDALVNRLHDTVLPQSGLTAYVTGPNAANVAFTNLVGNWWLPVWLARLLPAGRADLGSETEPAAYPAEVR